MFRSVKSMSTSELVFLLRNSFIFGFSIGAIGIMCLLLAALRKENLLIVMSAATIPLLLGLFLNILYRRVTLELSRRI